MNLNDIRKEIDQIDDELCELLCRRMECSLQVAAYKAENHLPVFNSGREEEILQRVGTACAATDHHQVGYDQAAKLTFATIMDCSRALQHRQLAAGEDLRRRIAAAQKVLPPKTPTVICQGQPGAFSDEAAAKLFPCSAESEHRPTFVSSFEDVFKAVRRGDADYGILPVENSSTGSVNEVYDFIMAYQFTITAAVELPIQHCLIVNPGTTLSQIERVVSHPQALSQCKDFIARHALTPIPFENTASAAKMLAECPDCKTAVIASARAASLYGLTILETSIQNVSQNYTRFIAIAREPFIPPDANKISLIFSLPHTTGSLYRILSRFSMAGLNLTKLESRPLQNGEFAYAFYLDFEGNIQHPATLDLLCALSEELQRFNFLGNYRELSNTNC